MTNSSEAVRVGILALHNSKESKAICNAVEALGHEPEWLRSENTAIGVQDGEVTVEPGVDVVANRLLLSNTPQPCEELGLARMFEPAVPMLNPPMPVMTAFHKFSAAAVLARADLPVPNAYFALDSGTLNAERHRFGESAVHKTAIGTHGGGTWRVGMGDEVNARVGTRRAFLQQLIGGEDGPPRDVRVYVVGGEVFGAMYRYAPENDWRTNVALGGSVEDASDELTEEAREIAIAATAAIGLDYAGVDLVAGDDGWYILEVNPTAGFKGLYEATQRSPASWIARLAIERVGGDVDDQRVQELEGTLDDSVPACRPPPRRPATSGQYSVGLTEEVLVTGSSDTKRVVAKSDTGAARSSIDTALAADIGAGPIKNITRIKSGSQKEARTRPLVDVIFGIASKQHTVTASIEDRSHMDYPVLLGRDVLRYYQVDVTRGVDSGGTVEAEEIEQ